MGGQSKVGSLHPPSPPPPPALHDGLQRVGRGGQNLGAKGADRQSVHIIREGAHCMVDDTPGLFGHSQTQSHHGWAYNFTGAGSRQEVTPSMYNSIGQGE